MNKKVLVLGGNGMIGEALKALCSSRSDLDFSFPLRNELDVRESQAFEKSDYVIDLVPSPPPRKYLELTSKEYHARFTTPHQNFISKILSYGIKKYIFLSSGGSIYGRTDKNIPFVESDKLEPVSFYGESKKILESHLVKESKKLNVSYTILRPSNVFNAVREPNLRPGLIGTIEQRIKNNESVDIFGNPDLNQKDYVSNVDVAQAVMLSLDAGDNEIMNIGTGVTISISEIIKSFEEKFQITLSKNHKPEIPNDVYWFCLNISKAQKILGYDPKLDFKTWLSQFNIERKP